MDDRKRIDPGEFREIGFLQEANRLFFHPHGLALEMGVVRDDDEYSFPMTYVGLDASTLATVRALLAGERVPEEDCVHVAKALDGGDTYEPGDCYFAGCWDSRDDPEGIYYGDWAQAAVEKADRVAAERKRHYIARARMFGQMYSDGLAEEAERIGDIQAVLESDLVAGLDIEPTDFAKGNE